MRYLVVVLAWAACSSVAAGTSETPTRQDGEWLVHGIRQYQRLSAHESLSEQDTNEAVVVSSYICGVVNFEKYLVHRANMLASALHEGGKRKPLIDRRMRAGMLEALPLLTPLMQTDFLRDDPSCDRVLVIVGGFLDQYPEVLARDAGALIEDALLASYDKADVP